MIHVGVEVKFVQVLNVLEASVVSLEANKKKLLEPDPKEDAEQSVSVSINLLV